MKYSLKYYSARSYWKKKNTKQREMSRLAYRARQLKCPVIIPFTKLEVIKRDGLACYLCQKVLTYKQATIDHVKPLSKGGFHCLSNVKIACLKCNQEKSAKILEVENA